MSRPVWKSKFYGAFVLNHRGVLHAIDATPARWRGDAGSSPLDHPTHWLISTQVPAPFNMAAAILTNREMLSLVDKVKMVPGLLPMLIEGQDFIDAQDELSVLEFMEKYGMPDTVNEEIFIARASA